MQDTLSPWFTDARADWESSVSAWLTDVAVMHGLGAIESVTTLKERPWSLVRQITFERGVYYFKACSATGYHEPGLLLFLQAQSSIAIPQIVAIEPVHKWILMADAGTPLGDHVESNQLSILCNALTVYAKMQMASTGWGDQLLTLGLPDRRMSLMPVPLTELLADDVIGTGHSADEVNEVRLAAARCMPEFERVCAALAQSSYAAALDHCDMHTDNLLVLDGAYRLIDWGDSCVTHPFCSLLVTLEFTLNGIPESERALWADTLRDTYLAPWEARFPRGQLLIDFKQALWVGRAARALSYAYMFHGADEEMLNQWRPSILGQLQMWVDG